MVTRVIRMNTKFPKMFIYLKLLTYKNQVDNIQTKDNNHKALPLISITSKFTSLLLMTFGMVQCSSHIKNYVCQQP